MASGSNTNPIVVIDHAGKNGLDAAAYFMGHGLQNVRCLRGGIDAWAQEVDTTMRRYKLGCRSTPEEYRGFSKNEFIEARYAMRTLLKFTAVSLLLHALSAPATITVTNIAQGCAGNHSLFLKSDGSLWGMGDGAYGGLGDGGNSQAAIRRKKLSSTALPGTVDKDFRRILHSLLIKSDGSFGLWVDDTYGQLGEWHIP